MQQQVLLDKLSEMLMTEQGAIQFCTAAAARATGQGVAGQFGQFVQQAAARRDALLTLIRAAGGDPDYVSPTARAAGWKASKFIESAVSLSGMSADEIALNDIENVLLLMTKAQAGWSLMRAASTQAEEPHGVTGVISKVVGAVTGDKDGATAPSGLQGAMQQAVTAAASVDEGVAWARDTLHQACLQMVMHGPAQSPDRWQNVISDPLHVPIESIHARPMDDEGLLSLAKQPAWQESLTSRALRPVPKVPQS